MTSRKFFAVVLVGMYAGAISLLVELATSWPLSLLWQLIRFVLVTLYFVALVAMTAAFIRQGSRDREWW